MAKDPNITADEARSMLNYDPETGKLMWCYQPTARKARNTRYAGKVAGCSVITGHILIRICGRLVFAHRLAWLIMTGNWPLNEIDHKDCDGGNNKWTNLREANRTENLGNMRRPSHNTSGSKGVSYAKRDKKWEAYITIENKKRGLGYFDSKEDAASAYAQAALKHFGKFARAS